MSRFLLMLLGRVCAELVGVWLDAKTRKVVDESTVGCI